MPRYLVCLTRITSEEAAVVLDADDEDDAKDTALTRTDLEWSPGDWASNDCEVSDVTEQDPDEPLGVQHDEDETRKRRCVAACAGLSDDDLGATEGPDDIERLRSLVAVAEARITILCDRKAREG